MDACLDDLVIALYVMLDDLLADRRRMGRPPQLTDAELVCLAIAQPLLGFDCQRRWVRFVTTRLGHLFPYVPKAPGYNKRLRKAGPLLAEAIRRIATDAPSWWDLLWLVDSTPVPCAASRETVKRSELAGWAGYGYCASHSRWFWGMRLYLICAPDGMPIIWGLANATLGEREVVTALLDEDCYLIRSGQVILGDKGFAGAELEAHVKMLGAALIRPDRKGEPRRFGPLGGMRQWIESIIDTLKGQLGLERHGGRTPAGLFARVAQRVLALAAGVWFNWQLNQPDNAL